MHKDLRRCAAKRQRLACRTRIETFSDQGWGDVLLMGNSVSGIHQPTLTPLNTALAGG